MAIPAQIPVTQERTQDVLIGPYKEGQSWAPVSGTGARYEWKVGEGVDISERLRQLAQVEELRFEATYPHLHSLPFLIFPEVVAQMLAYKGLRHSSPLLQKTAIESFKSHCKTINSNWSSLTIKKDALLPWHQPTRLNSGLGLLVILGTK